MQPTDGSVLPDGVTPSDRAIPNGAVTLPIELLGAPGTVSAVTIRAGSAAATASYLWLQTHRLTWREDGEFATTTAPRNSVRPGSKGSVRLNGGAWVPLTNATVTCEAHEAALGCLNGGYMTVRLRVAMNRLGATGLREGDNTLEFRFDATDGISSGWRVLALDVRTTQDRSVLATKLAQDDPDTRQPPLNTPADIAQGRTLWRSAPLTDVGFASTQHTIRGTCASCHFDDGYDLAYFNFSNRSIVARSVFHGLSERQGRNQPFI